MRVILCLDSLGRARLRSASVKVKGRIADSLLSMSELTDVASLQGGREGGMWKQTELLASRRSTTPESQWNEAEFCLYRYTPNYHFELVDSAPSDLQSSEGQARGSGFSLSLIGSSVANDREHLLREQIATKLSQGTLYPGNGQVSTLDPTIFPPPSQTYYCVLDIPRQTDKVKTDTDEETGVMSPLHKHFNRQYVVCFATLGKAGLDLFRTELDSFCAQLKPLLPDKPTEEAIKSFTGSSLQSVMSEWFRYRVQYISRVVMLCHTVLPELLNIAVNSKVEVCGPNQSNVEDVKLFLDACSMANVMQFEGEKKVAPNMQAQEKVTVTVSHNTCTLTSDESSQFCSNWAQVLLAHGTSNPDPFFLRQAVENYKLKIVQDLNAFKRLLREAESDYHALYRCYLFLSVCGNGKLLLQCTSQEAIALQTTSTLAVLEALQTFSQKNGFRKKH